MNVEAAVFMQQSKQRQFPEDNNLN
jgi:hypothetical protein